MSPFDYTKVPCCIKDKCKEFVLSEDQLREVKALFLEEVIKGLGKDTNPTAIVKCFVTYVQDLPNGTETGSYLALDLGGTNFRVLLITLDGPNFDMQFKIYEVPQHIMKSSGKELFTHIAECLKNFIDEHELQEKKLPLGFTFSFPVKQTGLTGGVLERWTKGFDCEGVVGANVVTFLKDSINELGVQIDVMAILNDTTGTLMSCAWKDHRTYIGLIIGTGSNACYVESIENAECFEGDTSKPYVIINTEWGAFGDDGKLDPYRTEYDKVSDQASINPGRQIFEKMISGMYLGEIARLALCAFAEQGLFLCNANGNFGKLTESGAVLTKHVSMIEKDDDDPDKYSHCKKFFAEIEIPATIPTEQDMVTVRYVCECISTRAAHLASAGLATLIEKMKRNKVTVGVDGTVYKLHPHFAERMKEMTSKLSPSTTSVTLMLSEDGSGRGAALVAAVASRESDGQESLLGAESAQLAT